MKLIHRTERRRPRSREVLGFEPKEKLPFDPTPEDRSRIRRYIETLPLPGINMIWMFCVLFPDQVDSLTEIDLVYATNTSEAENEASELTVLKLLHPKEFKQKNYKKTKLREGLKEALNTQLQTSWVDGKWTHWSDVAILYKILFPEDPSLLPSAEQLAEIREELAWNDPSRRKDNLDNLWSLTKMKLLFPEKFSDLQLDHDDWDEIRAKLDQLRETTDAYGDAPYMLAYTLFYAKILAAEQAEIDTQGNVVISQPAARKLTSQAGLPERSLL